MGNFTINPEITVGNILTVGTILISMISILISWGKDRRLRQKEYATPIRQSIGIIAAKLERWKEISISFFENIQPFLTDADVMLSKGETLEAVRDDLWRSLVEARAKYSQQILDENIETAYAELHGYDPRIRKLFVEAINRLRSTDKTMFNLVLELTQKDIQITEEPYISAKLGNSLRETCNSLRSISSALMDLIIDPFQREMEVVLNAKDSEIVRKKFNVSTPSVLFSLDRRSLQIDIELLKSHRLTRRNARNLLTMCEPMPSPIFSGGKKSSQIYLRRLRMIPHNF